MEDALISPEGFMILSGAGLVEASDSKPIYVHVSETSDAIYRDAETPTIAYVMVDQKVSVANGADIYAMAMKNGEIESEPFLANVVSTDASIPDLAPAVSAESEEGKAIKSAIEEGRLIQITVAQGDYFGYAEYNKGVEEADQRKYAAVDLASYFTTIEAVMVDYYTEKTSGAQQINITPDKFGGNYYLEASTLFRDTNGVDMPAEFIIPNCKVQSNFTFTMASSGRLIA